MANEEVVLLDEQGNKIGTTLKKLVHNKNTPLHLAFSCYLFNEKGELLLTRRALDKQTWPGVWTNSFCGHPYPEENFSDAITRYAKHELNVIIKNIQTVLPDYSYFAIDASGIVENEICPVYFAQIVGEFNPNPIEIVETQWLEFNKVINIAEDAPFIISPWAADQIRQISNKIDSSETIKKYIYSNVSG